jgi:predicted O-methyltransferase YrrM
MSSFEEVIGRVDRECRERRIPMLGRERSELIADLITEHRPSLIVEVGTAIGYSGLWIAKALDEIGIGKLITMDIDPDRSAEAGRNLDEAGLSNRVERQIGDAKELCKSVEGPVDFLILDGGFDNYFPCFLALKESLAPTAVIVADNVYIGEEEMKDYLDFVRAHYRCETKWFELDLEWSPKDAMEITWLGVE